MFKSLKIVNRYFFDFIKKPIDTFYINSFIDYNVDYFRLLTEDYNLSWGEASIISSCSLFIFIKIANRNIMVI